MRSAPLIRKDGRGDARWWLTDTEGLDGRSEVHQRLVPLVRFLRQRQSNRQKSDLLYASLYRNHHMQGFGLGAGAVSDQRLTFNLAKNMIGAVVSRITKNRPKASVVTNGADWGMQRRAKRLEKFLDGQFYRTKFRDKAVDAFRNACIYGTGVLKIFRNKNEINCEVVPTFMLLVDDTECLTAEPRNMYELRYVDREVLIATYAKNDPELEAELRNSKLHHVDEGAFGFDQTADQLLVFEAWHLGAGNEPGRHVICLDGLTLVDEEYARKKFPFVVIRWSKDTEGWYGLGLVSELSGIQAEVNKLLRQIQQAHHLCGWPRIFVQRGSKVSKAQLNNIIGAIVEYDGSPPHQAVFPTVPNEIYMHLQFLIKSAYEIAGVSQLAATGQKPAGIESGVALMTLQDVQTDRFTEVGRNWEQVHADGAEHMIELSAEIAKRSPDYLIRAMGDEELKEIKWSEAVMELGQYELQIFPTSLLPHTPAGRIQLADVLQKMQILDQYEAASVIDLPDTKGMLRRKMAGRDVIDMALERIKEDEEYVSPEPFDDLQYAVVRGQQEYDLARLKKAPESVKSSLMRWIEAANQLLNPPPPPVPPGAPPGAAPPPGGPPALPPGPGPAGPPPEGPMPPIDLPPGAGAIEAMPPV